MGFSRIYAANTNIWIKLPHSMKIWMLLNNETHSPCLFHSILLFFPCFDMFIHMDCVLYFVRCVKYFLCVCITFNIVWNSSTYSSCKRTHRIWMRMPFFLCIDLHFSRNALSKYYQWIFMRLFFFVVVVFHLFSAIGVLDGSLTYIFFSSGSVKISVCSCLWCCCNCDDRKWIKNTFYHHAYFISFHHSLSWTKFLHVVWHYMWMKLMASSVICSIWL